MKMTDQTPKRGTSAPKEAPVPSDYHRRQYDGMYDSSREMFEFMEACLSGSPDGLSILDAACGGGANAFHMAQKWPSSSITGVDRKPELIAYAAARHRDSSIARAHFICDDLFNLHHRFGTRAFDITTFYHTMMMFDPDTYPSVLQSLIAVTKRWVFLNSLFTDKKMDVSSDIRLYVPCDEYVENRVTYNTLCIDRFTRVAKQLGALDVRVRDYQIRIDLPGPPEGGLGTYTVRTQDGDRLQFSGSVLLPWKYVALRLS